MAVAPRPRGPNDKDLKIRLGPTHENGTEVREVPAAFPMTSVAFSPDLECYFAPMALGDNRIGLFKTETAELIREFGVKEYPRDIHFADEEHLVVTYTGGVTIYNVYQAGSSGER